MSVVEADLREGDVLEWTPEDRWCHEGMAVVERRPDGSLVAVDTYWTGGSDHHVLRGAEIAGARVIANLADFEACASTRLYPFLFEDFDDVDQLLITRQRGHVLERYLRRGAQPSAEVRRRNGNERVRDAKQQIRSAQSALETARIERAALEMTIAFEEQLRRRPFVVGDRVRLSGTAWRGNTLNGASAYGAVVTVDIIDHLGRPCVTVGAYPTPCPIHVAGRFGDYRADLVEDGAL